MERKINAKITLSVFAKCFCLWWVFGVLFFVVSFALLGGGSVLAGKIEHGHYFSAKGTYFHEVSRTVFILGGFLESARFGLTALLAVLYGFIAVREKNLFWFQTEWKPK